MNKIKIPSIIDVQASGSGKAGYPIEVGFALDDGKRYSTLILPIPEWDEWDENAEKIHHIPRETLLKHGKSVGEVADSLNEALGGMTLYTDGQVANKPWLSMLFEAAGKPMDFFVSPIESILSKGQMAKWNKTKEEIKKRIDLTRHRASFDAWITQKTFRQTLDDS